MTVARLIMETEENDSGVISESRQRVNFHFCWHPTIVINKVIMQPQQGAWAYFKSFFFIAQKYSRPYGEGERGLKYAVSGYVNKQRIFILINTF